MDTICAKKISLCDNRDRSKGKSCRSASSHYEKSILQESNFDILKEEVKKLDEDISIYALYRCKLANKTVSTTLDTRILSRSQRGEGL